MFLDEKQLVVLDLDSGQRIRSDVVRGTADKLRNASRRHGYPWFDQDPYADLFLRWEPDTADLLPAANALLKVRADALEKQSAEDLDELGDELHKLGYVVRQTQNTQYWRSVLGGSGEFSADLAMWWRVLIECGEGSDVDAAGAR